MYNQSLRIYFDYNEMNYHLSQRSRYFGINKWIIFLNHFLYNILICSTLNMNWIINTNLLNMYILITNHSIVVLQL